MAKTKISEFSATPANNTDIDGININEGCAPSGINDAIRELMAQLKDFQTGAVGDSFNGPIGTSTAAAGAFTTLSATGAITSTLATGTAPLVIASTTKVANLNVDLLDGADWAAPAALGSTTPAAVSATTLAASSTVTLSGGTANGVAYLNGSKVVTSGSALTFDGTNLGLTGSSRISQLLDGAYLQMQNAGATANWFLQTSSLNLSFTSAQNGAAIWSINGSEQMRLTSTGLGIGTTAPITKLQVNSGSSFVGGFKSTVANGYIALQDSGTSGALTDGNVAIGAISDALAFRSGGATRMRLDSSGNLGLGVTPSAWFSNQRAFQIGDVGSFRVASSSVFGINNNAYFAQATTDWRYSVTGFSTRYDQESGQHRFFTAASGTAGAAITFTQAMTLDANGNLGVGTTSPNITAGYTNFVVSNATNGGLIYVDRPSGARGYFYANGTTSVVLGTSGSYPLTFETNTVERARITADGNLLVATTNNSGTNTGGFNLYNDLGASRLYIGHVTGTANGTQYVVFNYAGTNQIGSITQSGTTAVLYNTTSDQRLKENIQNAESASSLIDSLQVRKFDWKSNGSHQRYGFIAQELVTVAPEAVHQPEDTEQMMAVDYSKLVPMLVKEIQSLRKRLADAGI